MGREMGFEVRREESDFSDEWGRNRSVEERESVMERDESVDRDRTAAERDKVEGQNSAMDKSFTAGAWNVYKNQGGFALLMTLAMVTLVTIFALGITTVVTSTMRGTVYVEQANEAFFAAEAGLEEGLYYNSMHEAGYEEEFVGGEDFTGENDAQADFEVKGRPVEITAGVYIGDYVAPRPGTGSAGSDCDPLDEVTYADDLDNECNWNKLHYGETVGIPLYRDDGTWATGQDVLEAVDVALSDLVVRIRVPAGYELNDHGNDYRHEDNDVVVNWEIRGDCEYDPPEVPNTCALLPRADLLNVNSDTRITEFDIDLVGGGIYDMVQNFRGIDEGNRIVTIYDFLRNSAGDFEAGRTINKPILKLSVIHSLFDATQGVSIPYLEYQVITDEPLANVYQIISAEGVSGSFKQSLEIKEGQETGVMEFVIHQ